MTARWREDGPSTPDRIKTGAGATLATARGARAAVVAVGAVAVVLVAALIWVTLSAGGGDEAAPAGKPATASETPVDDGPVADGEYRISIGGPGSCLGLSPHGGDVDRIVLAAMECEGDGTRFTVDGTAPDTVRIGFLDPDFADDYCLQADGPELDDEAAEEDDVYYFAPYACDAEEPMQEFTLSPSDDGTLRLRTAAGQCLAVFEDHEFAEGRVVATAPCSEPDHQQLQFHPS
ncbi:hypothetical protein LX16_3914 [Stackebrandtia albiflava]|uniref:Uncharacterized protein n=1 Tax=Stackebrandtia albiflava TaxID=406432 RepID=A0A562UY16_9ACTN|nr:hypothetical protein [Stackebrandtia albiflava]TWJ10497.1 hypothetical protein LX16_3914 [Stackebrandtia albiflava]